MDGLVSYTGISTEQELTDCLNLELNRAAWSFVRIGYLLKRARDGILENSGYPDLYTYANMKFGLDKSMISRFININDRFSVDGYSDKLQEKYEGFGYSKLALMLTLPEEINEELSPEMSKNEINLIKSEYEAEQKISDLEVMMEEKQDGPDEFIAQIVKELNDEHPESAVYLNTTMKMAEKMAVEVNETDIQEAYNPEGTTAYSIRIPGQGRFMIYMKESGITIVSLRDPENKSPLSWTEFKEALMEDMKVRDFPEEEKPKKKKKPEKVKPAKVQNEKPVAPVQQSVEECADNVPQDDTPKEVVEDPEDKAAAGEEDTGAAGETDEASGAAGEDIAGAAGEADEAPGAAGVEKVTPDAEDVLTSSQRDMLDWLDMIRRKVVPEDGSRPDWLDIYGEIKSMGMYLKQFTY